MFGRVIGLAMVGFLMVPVAAVAEDLPWLKKQDAAPAPMQKSGGALPWENSASQAPVKMAPQTMEAPQTRELDDRKLNALAEDYYAILEKNSISVSQLTTLQKQVKDFHKALDGRTYDAHDIIADVSKLEERIAAAKKKAVAAVTKVPAKAATKK